jgi:regulatory protein
LNEHSTNFIEEIAQKLEHYCSYQERCHVEVQEKLRQFTLSEHEKNQIIVHLIEHNYLNEERFASVFSISKFHQKKWGKIRIKSELKSRKISEYLITKALSSISLDEYESTFKLLAEKQWEAITEKNPLKKRKKYCDYLLRKGWESDLVYAKMKELEK